GCSGIKSEIRKNIHLGATPGDRIKTLATGRRMAAILSAITAVLITDYGDGLWSAIPVLLLEEAAPALHIHAQHAKVVAAHVRQLQLAASGVAVQLHLLAVAHGDQAAEGMRVLRQVAIFGDSEFPATLGRKAVGDHYAGGVANAPGPERKGIE